MDTYPDMYPELYPELYTQTQQTGSRGQVPGKGWGVFANGLIPAGRFVCEYAGEVVRPHTPREHVNSATRSVHSGVLSASLPLLAQEDP
eukprot:1181126-Prorocentrum_minimum.AAC.1